MAFARLAKTMERATDTVRKFQSFSKIGAAQRVFDDQPRPDKLRPLIGNPSFRSSRNVEKEPRLAILASAKIYNVDRTCEHQIFEHPSYFSSLTI